ncbi:hypothetical protein EX30DRAFT_132471 [Ascodesmis nigricans]|uniref:Uncharacterized protein n=1 Tax=Ascodesmis nigricans TaxID=341454 RepID=A0A4S2MNB9_9PEZI|nr:hypothetical protein EX30DRAFT_132471 [Ascodesmis nigricans]
MAQRKLTVPARCATFTFSHPTLFISTLRSFPSTITRSFIPLFFSSACHRESHPCPCSHLLSPSHRYVSSIHQFPLSIGLPHLPATTINVPPSSLDRRPPPGNHRNTPASLWLLATAVQQISPPAGWSPFCYHQHQYRCVLVDSFYSDTSGFAMGICWGKYHGCRGGGSGVYGF